MASLGSSIRSAARATFSAYRSLPIRWRLAGGSAVLTFVILAGFAVIVGVLTGNQVRGQFNDEVRSAAEQLQQELNGKLRFTNTTLNCGNTTVHLSDYASAEQAQIRFFDNETGLLLCTQDEIRIKGAKKALEAPVFPSLPAVHSGTFTESGYRVVVEQLKVLPSGQVTLLYARPTSDIDHTLARVQFFLLLGVVGGTALALLAGLATAQRAVRPIRQLTAAAREVQRTRDPTRRIPKIEADDEVAELARTLEGMLHSLSAARGETEAMLERQREFIADASHELRTPLTSVLANLELLAEELDGEQAESAEAALRSTRRMRRLVGDLLLLARADAGRPLRQDPTDLADVLTDVTAELHPVAEGHELSIDAEPAVVPGNRDDLHRLTLNLMENAVRHTPPGTQIRASTCVEGATAMLVVEDDGPGISPEMEQRVFERFVRGGGEQARGSGLGLSIVRAVVEFHHGTISLERPETGNGTRFVIRIPTVAAAAGAPAADAEAQTSTTTGSTIGRRRSRS